MRVLLSLALLLLLPLSGCLGDVSATDDAPGGDDDAADAGEGATAGGADTPTTASNATREVPVYHAGSTQGGACVFTIVAGACVVPYGNAWVDLAGRGPHQALHAQVTWDAATPATGELLAYLLVRGSNDLWRWEQGYPEAWGSSPLALEWDLSPFAGREVAAYVILYGGACAVVACAYAYVPQAFVFDGVLVQAA